MNTLVVAVDPQAPDAALIAQAAEVVRAGGLVAFPTETVYGLGANALSQAAVARIFAAKGRPGNNPLIVHIADLQSAQLLTCGWSVEADLLARHFWPGPLTLVVPRAANVPDVVTGGGDTVGVRMPAHPVALALVRAAGVPVAAPSANRSTELSPTLAEHVVRGLSGRIDMILDGGPTSGGLESTVVDLSMRPFRLLRPGPIAPAALEELLGPLQRRIEVPESGALPAPGLLARHYAPRTPLFLADNGREMVARLVAKGERVAWLIQNDTAIPGVEVVRMPDRAAEYAACLYAVLHQLDGHNLAAIVVQLPPAGEEWLAIHDRLRRAATP